ncbi:hypothetical protein CANCADRAFT_3584 [Tortispora caseinolytica NRRL Y-17796]|uniref:C3H1-type domain-containing protein n=1 Tax=Tortispora caseinolytica NRRL Y-17796 TaxID=767744 RepID=A0A1E4TB65_9ASCO|nr:hypothetical protein CANCADRAFT_3584 [Tortispora caseinolytica NRRL Y-17796]
MPPKKQKPSDKTKASKRQQSAEDKTFGLKNKNRSAKVQKYVQQVQNQSQTAEQKRKEADNARKLAEKKAAEQAKAEAALLFNPIIQQKVPFGVDPKTVLCAYFKQGTCTKGSKCKFSHDLDIERKSVKKDLYTDQRVTKEQETVDDWDTEKLQKVVQSKHGNQPTPTNIICKYFLSAVEDGKYGWLWVCPNGGDNCRFKHSLPPGYELKTKEQRKAERLAAENAPVISLEEFIEIDRSKLGKELHPVNEESFKEWKAKKEEERLKLEEKKAKDKSRKLTGREILLADTYVENDNEDQGNAFDVEELRQRTEEVRIEQ